VIRRVWARARCGVVPVVALLSVTLPKLGQGVWQGDSALYSGLGLQGWRTGSLWVLMTEPGVPYLKKPPLPLWIHGLSLHVLGPELAPSRMPTVLAACGCVLAVVVIARTLWGRWASLLCGLAMALTYDFFHRAGGVSLDVWQLLFMLLSVALAAKAVAGERPSLLSWAGVPLGLALMCKPFMALVAVPLLGAWLVWIGRARWIGWLAAGTGVALAVAAPWHLSMYALYGDPFIDEYLGHEVVQRAMGEMMPGHDEPEPPWFYGWLLLTRYWPWLIPLAGGLVLMARRRALGRDGRLNSLGLIWAAGWLIALSAFPDRRDRYDVPIFAGTSLLVAAWMASSAPRSWRASIRLGARLAPVLLPVGAILFAALPVQVYSAGNGQWQRLEEWSAGAQPRQLWNGGAGMAQCAETYLVTGIWPQKVRAGTQPETGSLVLYHTGGGLSPGPGEAVLFEHADVTVTRLDGAWTPRGDWRRWVRP
jgi:4-amino-4-deoxy-L-arabinose transferase-like glycosyltransferase